MTAPTPLALDRIRLSAHARSAMARRDVWPEEVAAALTRWDVREEEGSGRVRFVLGALCVVVAEADTASPVILTVLLRSTATTWTDADVRARRVSA